MKIKKISFQDFNYIYSRVPRLCVEVIIRTKDGILLTKRAIVPVKGQWHTPGGTVYKGESLEQAVKRVAKEELGVKVKIQKMLGVLEYRMKNYNGWPISVAYAAQIIAGDSIKLDEQASEYAYFRILPRNMVREQKSFLEKTFHPQK